MWNSFHVHDTEPGLYLERGMGDSPQINNLHPNFWKSGGRSPPYLTKSYIAFVSNAPFPVDRPRLFLNIKGDFPLKIWNLDKTLQNAFDE